MTFWIYLFGILTIGASIGVVASGKPLSSALWLVLTFFLLAVHYALLRADFIAAVQVVVYAGAIMVLVVFVIMLLGLSGKSAIDRSPFITGLSILFGGGFAAMLVKILSELPQLPLAMPRVNLYPTVVIPPEGLGSTESIGQVLFTKYIYPFEITSLLLLAAIIGAVLLSLDAKRPLEKGRGLKAMHKAGHKEG